MEGGQYQWIDHGVRVWLFFLLVLTILVFDYVIFVPYANPFFWAILVCVFLRRVHTRLVDFFSSIVPWREASEARSASNSRATPTTQLNTMNSKNQPKSKGGKLADDVGKKHNTDNNSKPNYVAKNSVKNAVNVDSSNSNVAACLSDDVSFASSCCALTDFPGCLRGCVVNFVSIFWSLLNAFRLQLIGAILVMTLLVLAQSTFPPHISHKLGISDATPLLFLNLALGLVSLVFFLTICLMLVRVKTLVSIGLIFCFVFFGIFLVALFFTKCSSELTMGAFAGGSLFNHTSLNLGNNSANGTQSFNFSSFDAHSILQSSQLVNYLSLSPEQVNTLLSEGRAVMLNWTDAKFGQSEIVRRYPILLELGQRALAGYEAWYAAHVTPMLYSIGANESVNLACNASLMVGPLSTTTIWERLYQHLTNEELNLSTIDFLSATNATAFERIQELMQAFVSRSVDVGALAQVAAGYAGQIVFVTLSTGLVLIRDSIYQFASAATFLGISYTILESNVDPLDILVEIIPGDVMRRRVRAKTRAYVHGLFVSTLVDWIRQPPFFTLWTCRMIGWRFEYLTTLAVGIFSIFPLVHFSVAFIPMVFYFVLTWDYGWTLIVTVFLLNAFLG